MTKSKKLTNEQIEKNLANVKASLAMEKLYLTDEELEVLRKHSKGELTEKEVFKIFNI